MRFSAMKCTLIFFCFCLVSWSFLHDLDTWDETVSLVSVTTHGLSFIGILIVFVFFFYHYSALRDLFAIRLILCIAVKRKLFLFQFVCLFFPDNAFSSFFVIEETKTLSVSKIMFCIFNLSVIAFIL